MDIVRCDSVRSWLLALLGGKVNDVSSAKGHMALEISQDFENKLFFYI